MQTEWGEGNIRVTGIPLGTQTKKNPRLPGITPHYKSKESFLIQYRAPFR